MLSFHNDTKIKTKYLNRVAAHRKADELVQGATGEDGRGCAVWCTLDKYQHVAYETELGIPEWLARVEDTIFEGLPQAEAQKWPEQFLSAIKPGVDLEKAKAPFLIFVCQAALKTFDHKKFPDVKKCLDRVIELWRDGGTPEEFARAAWAAEAAARAARAAEAAAWAAEAAARAARAAEAAARAAEAAAWAARAAEADSYKNFAKKLLEILEGTK